MGVLLFNCGIGLDFSKNEPGESASRIPGSRVFSRGFPDWNADFLSRNPGTRLLTMDWKKIRDVPNSRIKFSLPHTLDPNPSKLGPAHSDATFSMMSKFTGVANFRFSAAVAHTKLKNYLNFNYFPENASSINPSKRLHSKTRNSVG